MCCLFSQRGEFEMHQLDSIHVQRYSLKRKGDFFILGLLLFNLTDGPILYNSLPAIPKNYFPR